MRFFFKCAGAAILAVVAGLVAVNLFDEDPLPQAGTYGKPRPAVVPEERNGYLALIAMNAPDGADAMAYARAWLAEARASAREGRRSNMPAAKQSKRPELCDPGEAACLARVRTDGAQISGAVEASREDLQRYENLVAFREFEEILDYPVGVHHEFPAYLPLLRGQRAWLVRAALDFEAGRHEEGIAALEREMAWQRLFLYESRTVLGKMVAVSGYWRDLRFISAILQSRAAELRPFFPRIRALLVPLDGIVAGLPRVLEAEFAFAAASIAQIGKEDADAPDGTAGVLRALPFLYKPNATLNDAYRYYSTLGSSVYAAPADRVAAEARAFVRAWNDPPWWRYAYNPVGRILQSIALPEWHEYPLRVHDLIALDRLVQLQAGILAGDVAPERIPQYVAAEGERYHDPYTRKPMSWDAAKRRLQYAPTSRHVRGLKHGVEDGRVFVGL